MMQENNTINQKEEEFLLESEPQIPEVTKLKIMFIIQLVMNGISVKEQNFDFRFFV
jgi:hypothetical protein